MEVIKNQYAVLWNGEVGKVLDTTASKANLLLESGKRSWESFDKIIDAIDTISSKEVNFLQAKERLSSYKKKKKASIEKHAPGKFGSKKTAVERKKWNISEAQYDSEKDAVFETTIFATDESYEEADAKFIEMADQGRPIYLWGTDARGEGNEIAVSNAYRKEYEKIKEASKKTAVSPPGWEKTVEKMRGHKEITNPWALSHWMAEEGYKPSASVKDITKAYASYKKETASKKTAQYPDKKGWYVYDKGTGEVLYEGLETSGEAHDRIEDLYAQGKEGNFKLSYSSADISESIPEHLRKDTSKKTIKAVTKKVAMDIRKRVSDFLLNNPSPTDSEFHTWAEKEGIATEKAEAAAYDLATEHVRMGQVRKEATKKTTEKTLPGWEKDILLVEKQGYYTPKTLEDREMLKSILNTIRPGLSPTLHDEETTKTRTNYDEAIWAASEAGYSFTVEEAPRKEAGHPDDFSTKYKVGDVLVPSDGSDNTDQIHVLGISEKNYILERRPLPKEDKPKEDDVLYGVRYEVPFKTLDGDKKFRRFSSTGKSAQQEIFDIFDDADSNDSQVADSNDSQVADSGGNKAYFSVLTTASPIEEEKVLAEHMGYIGKYARQLFVSGSDIDDAKKKAEKVIDLFNSKGYESHIFGADQHDLVMEKAASINEKMKAEGAEPMAMKTMPWEEGRPTDLASVEEVEGGNIKLSFEGFKDFKDFDATYSPDGNLIGTSSNEEQFATAYREEFGNMIKHLGYKKLAGMVTLKRLKRLEAKRSAMEKESNVGGTTMKKIASLKKKAELLGDYDFDVHKNWELEACEDGKKKLVKVKK